ncbi:MAG: outer membrane lipoprotein LolB [Methylophilaceae bacterium]|nr:MAG: outer membrane lipoprotein LolB [Methylophilaceae bacterium]
MKYLWLFIALFLHGCATTAPQKKPASGLKPSVLHKQHMEQIANIQQFSLRGRLGVIAKPKNFSARLTWQHTQETDSIDVYSPLGGKVAHIAKTPDSITLTDNNKKNTVARDAETLTEKTLGFKLPLSGLSHWALGRPVDKGLVNAVTWDENGRISTLQQNGWLIQYKNYVAKDAYFLPKKVILKNDRITLKLLIEKWADIK